MNIKNDKYLKLESDYSNSTQTNVSNSIRSPLSSTKHLILNFYEEPSNLKSSQQSNLELYINDSINNNNNDDNNNDNNNNNDNDNNNNNNDNNNNKINNNENNFGFVSQTKNALNITLNMQKNEKSKNLN